MDKAKTYLMTAAAVSVLAVGVAACGGDDDGDAAGSGNDSGQQLSGTIRIDGSSTVAPLSEAAAEEFNDEHSDVRVTVGTSGTGGGFEKFCAGETDISGASRRIKPEEEELCAQNGVEYEELVVANDALTVVVNPENPVQCMTVEQLSQIWGEDSQVSSWGDIDGLDVDFDEELQLFGPGTDSGTFDYFTEAVNGEEGVQRSDYNNVGEDDNATVTGVSGSPGGMGYFGYSFFAENEGRVKALEINDGESGCVPPSPETVQDGSYTPLGRQLYIYPSAESLQRPEVQAFVQAYVENGEQLAEQAGFIGTTEEQQQESLQKVEQLTSRAGGGAEEGTDTTETTE